MNYLMMVTTTDADDSNAASASADCQFDQHSEDDYQPLEDVVLRARPNFLRFGVKNKEIATVTNSVLNLILLTSKHHHSPSQAINVI